MSKASRALLFIMAAFAVAATVYGAENQSLGKCFHCNMWLDTADKKYSVFIEKPFDAPVFDDIGCALRWRSRDFLMRSSSFDRYARVHDFNTEEAIPIDKAFFVHNAGVGTPMGYDIAAFKNRENAEKLAKERRKGRVLTFSQLKKNVFTF